MAWRVADPRSGQDLVLVLPRQQPADAPGAASAGMPRVRKAARLNHPHLAAVVETGVVDGWPFVAYDPRDAPRWPSASRARACRRPTSPTGRCRACEGLAFAHEAGVAHHDLQPYLVLRRRQRRAAPDGPGGRARRRLADAGARRTALDAGALAAQRGAAAARRAGLRPAAAPGAGRHAAAGRARPRARRRRSCRRSGARSCACRGPLAQPDPRAAARHRQPRHRPPGAPALPQCAHAGCARCRAGCKTDSRIRRRPAGPAARPAAQRRPAAGVARRGRARRAHGADGARAHDRAGRGRAAGPGADLRAAARWSTPPRCAAPRWPAAARC